MAQQGHAHLHFHLFQRQHIRRLIHRPCAFGIHFVLLLLSLRQQNFRIGLTFGLQTLFLRLGHRGNAHRFGFVQSRLLLGLSRHSQGQGFFLRFLCRTHQFHRFHTLGALGFAYRHHFLLGLHCLSAGFVGQGLGFRFGTGFFRYRNGTVLFGQFHCFALFYFGALNQLFFLNVFIFQISRGQDAFQFHFTVGGNLSFFGFTLFGRFLRGNLSQLLGFAHRNFPFLLHFCIFFFTQNLQTAAFGF